MLSMVKKNIIEDVVDILPFSRGVSWTVATCLAAGGLVLLASGIGSCSCKAEETSTNNNVYVFNGKNGYSLNNYSDNKK